MGDVRNPLALNAAANGVDAVLVAVGASPVIRRPSPRPSRSTASRTPRARSTPRRVRPAKVDALQLHGHDAPVAGTRTRAARSIPQVKCGGKPSRGGRELGRGQALRPEPEPGGPERLLVGQDDALLNLTVPVVARADVGLSRSRRPCAAKRNRFDLRARGAPTTDLGALLDAARHPGARRPPPRATAARRFAAVMPRSPRTDAFFSSSSTGSSRAPMHDRNASQQGRLMACSSPP